MGGNSRRCGFEFVNKVQDKARWVSSNGGELYPDNLKDS